LGGQIDKKWVKKYNSSYSEVDCQLDICQILPKKIEKLIKKNNLVSKQHHLLLFYTEIHTPHTQEYILLDNVLNIVKLEVS